MSISIVIPHWNKSKEHNNKLHDCLNSLGWDISDTNIYKVDGSFVEKSVTGDIEFIVVSNQGTGFAKNVNIGMKEATGDYIMVVNNDLTLATGKLKWLCKEGIVTSPKVNGKSQKFWGAFFVVPQTIYKKVGGLCEDYKTGYYEDDDYIKTLENAGVEMRCIESVNVIHIGGYTMNTLSDKDELMRSNRQVYEERWEM